MAHNVTLAVRKIASWTLYRVATHVGSIAAAVPALKALRDDEHEEVRDMAESALEAEAARR